MAVQISGNDITVPRDGTFSRNVSIAGTLTYEDVTNVDSIGLVTARNGIEVGASPGVAASISVDGNAIFSGITTIGGNVKVGTGITLSPDGDIFATGVTTSTTFVGDLTGTATNANHISVADNESTNENNLIPFIEDASATGNVGLESDGDFTYNPSTGTVSATSFSGSGANLTGISAGITMMDQWRITGDNNKTHGQTIDSNWERSDTYFAQLGSGMSESSGVFTFPSTGIYFILAQVQMNGNPSYGGAGIQISTDSGSSYASFAEGYQNMSTVGGYHHVSLHGIVDITNVSTHRVLLQAVNSAQTQYSASSSYYRTGLTFIRLGDT